MEITNEFEVPAPIDDVWRYLLDVDKVAPCMPGAQLTETIDDRNWKGRVTMKFGPVALAFAGTVTMQDRVDATHRVVLHASGMEQRGKGAANATVTSTLERDGDSTKVRMQADVTLTGAVAQLSRGLLPDVSAKLTQQFASCLRTNMAAEAATPAVPEGTEESPELAPAPPQAAAPVGGLRLGLSALVSSIVRWFRKLFGIDAKDR
ncbi:MAG: SRPBCC family protein [Actinomycetota bacterium]